MYPESLSVPKRPDLITEGHVSDLFVQSIVRWRSEMEAVFNTKTNEHASWPSANPRELFAQFASRPQLAIQMSLELSTMILEIEEAGGVLLEKQAYAHQLAQLKWLALSLLEGGTSYLIEGAPGSGKTLVLGAIMCAATRLQVRGLMSSAVVYGTHRPYILAQQTFSPGERRMRLMEPPSAADARNEAQYCYKILGSGSDQFLPMNAWHTLRKVRYPDTDAALHALSDLIKAQKGGEEFYEQKKDVLPELTRLLTGEGVLVYDIDDSMMLIPLSPAEATADEGAAHYRGDIGRGIPIGYAEAGLIAARKGADVEGNAIEKVADARKLDPGVQGNMQKIAAAKEEMDAIRVLLTTAPSIVIRSHRTSIADILARTGIIIVDEGREAATRFQDAVEEVNPDTPKPLVFVASALSTTNGLGSRPFADRYSPRLTIEDAMEPGPDGMQVLPNVGVDMFPDKGSVLYDSETGEAIQQLVIAHFAELDVPEKAGLPQPHLCASLVVVSPDAIAAAVRALREEYVKRGIAADIIPFCKTQNSAGKGNNKLPHSERVLEAMMDDYSDERGKRVRILVASPDSIKDALSIPNLQNVTIGTAKGIGENTLLRIFGRLQHSNLHKKSGPEYRGYFRQGLYQNTKAKETIFHLLAEREGESICWTPLQILKGDAAAKKDVEFVQGLPQITIPLSEKNLHSRREEKGMTVKQIELNRQYAAESAFLPSKQATIDRISASDAWEKLGRIADRAVSQGWENRETYLAFIGIVLERVLMMVPLFMSDAWPAWEKELMIEMDLQRSKGPHQMLEAVKRRILAAATLGHIEDEMTVQFAEVDEEEIADEEQQESEENNETTDESAGEEAESDEENQAAAEEIDEFDEVIADMDDDVDPDHDPEFDLEDLDLVDLDIDE